jgi:hypothetical protein
MFIARDPRDDRSPCIAVPVFSAAMKRSCSPGFSRGRNA